MHGSKTSPGGGGERPPPFAPGFTNAMDLNPSAPPPLAVPAHDGGLTVVAATAVLDDASGFGEAREEAMGQPGDADSEMSDQECSRTVLAFAAATLVVALILGLFVDAAFHRCTPLGGCKGEFITGDIDYLMCANDGLCNARGTVGRTSMPAGCAYGKIDAPETLPACDCLTGWEGEYCESCGPSNIYEGVPFGDLGCWNIANRATVLGAEGTVPHSASRSFLHGVLDDETKSFGFVVGAVAGLFLCVALCVCLCCG
jgi:hypothetical protein|eukprot:COSAG02_NODE_597_length_19775_cov_28.914312_18_plen_257_part_00